MCGIIGIIAIPGALSSPLGSVIKRCLKNLEYRGYDSVGFAIYRDGAVIVRKSKGKLDDVAYTLAFDSFDGLVGIGHTRWATHGKPSDENAHPHTDCEGRVAVVHNGIIENYLELRDVLIERGHRFRSETDTETIPHLIEEFLKRGFRPYEAFKKAVSLLKGAYAIVALIADEPDKLFFARMTSPLILGFGRNVNFLASDIPAFLEYTNRILVLEDGELGYISAEGVIVEKLLEPGRFDDTPAKTVPVDISKRVRIIDWTPEMAQKGGFPHFMLKEIHEQPNALSSTLAGVIRDVEKALDILRDVDRVYLVAAGTSYHASILGAMYLNELAEIPSFAIISSEARWWFRSLRGDEAVIAVSQSGETIDTLLAVRYARSKGAKVIAISNVVDSAIPRESDMAIYTRAGPEIGVAATKTFTTQVLTLLVLARRLAGEPINGIHKIPEVVSRVISYSEPKARKLSRVLKEKTNAFYLGRWLGVPVSMEGALKMKEIAYLHAEAYPAGESKHGPIALVEEGYPTVFTSVGGEDDEMLLSNVNEMKARGAFIITVAPKESKLHSQASFRFRMPRVNPYLAPIPYIIPHQLMAYYTATARGYDPDKPRNLAKTVTVE